MSDPFERPDPAARRAERVYAALARLTERHAATPERRARHSHASVVGPHEAVRLVTAISAGSVPPGPDEPAVDATDLLAALTLLPDVRAELDAAELHLLRSARARGLTWQDIAFGLGLQSAQAARQRHDRLETRTPSAQG